MAEAEVLITEYEGVWYTPLDIGGWLELHVTGVEILGEPSLLVIWPIVKRLLVFDLTCFNSSSSLEFAAINFDISSLSSCLMFSWAACISAICC